VFLFVCLLVFEMKWNDSFFFAFDLIGNRRPRSAASCRRERPRHRRRATCACWPWVGGAWWPSTDRRVKTRTERTILPRQPWRCPLATMLLSTRPALPLPPRMTSVLMTSPRPTPPSNHRPPLPLRWIFQEFFKIVFCIWQFWTIFCLFVIERWAMI